MIEAPTMNIPKKRKGFIGPNNTILGTITNANIAIIINIPARMIFAVFPITGELVLNKGLETLLFFVFTTFDAISCKAP